MDGIVIEPGGGERIPRGEQQHRILAELPELEVIELRFGPDFEGVDLHSHADHVDSFYVLEGEAEFTFGAEVVRAGPGAPTSPLLSAPRTGFATPATVSSGCSTSTHQTRASAFDCVGIER